MKKVIIGAAALAVAFAFVGCCKTLQDRAAKEVKKVELPPPPGGATGVAGAVAALEGRYAGAGTNPDGSTYKCEVEIKKNGQVYPVSWYFDGKLGYEGTGVMKNGTLVVGYANDAGYGVVAYTVNADGTLDGTWTGKGATKAGSEKLTRK